MNTPSHLYVGIDIGGHRHQVAVCDSEGTLCDEFPITHDAKGFECFFSRIALLQESTASSVLIAMEGVNGHARPLDRLIQERGYPLYNMNNLKLARFKEIFPAPAKTDTIDARSIAELLRLRPLLSKQKEILQLVTSAPPENERLKRLTRRRRQLVEEKVLILGRLYTDLQAAAPGLADIAIVKDARWFLRFLTSRPRLRELAGLEEKDILALPAIGKVYVERITQWQHNASFSTDEELVSTMVTEDARRILTLQGAIAKLDKDISSLLSQSLLARTINSIPGFGVIARGGTGRGDRHPGALLFRGEPGSVPGYGSFR